ncbi:DUF58 domain-containing protein [bacterium]|nr:DUF58 domain-containing protein [bacterium]
MPHITPQQNLETSGSVGNQKLAGENGGFAPARRLRLTNRVTVEGAMFISLALLIGVAAINTGTNLLYLVLGVMLAMLLTSGLLSRNNMRKLGMARHYPLTVHAGEPSQGMIEVMNNKRTARAYSLGAMDELVGPVDSWMPAERHGARGFAGQIGKRERAWCPVTIELAERGIYKFDRARLVSRYPFGFLEHTVYFEQKGSVLAYPRLFPASVFMQLSPRVLGEIDNNRKGVGIGIFGVRNYEAGDPVRFIHWKQSAKGQGLKTKEFEEEVAQSFLLMLDLRCPANPPRETLEQFENAVSLAASLARHLIRDNAAVGLWTSAGNIGIGSGTHHLNRIMRTLACVQPQPPDAVAATPPRGLGRMTHLGFQFQSAAPFPGLGGADFHVIDVRKLKTK